MELQIRHIVPEGEARGSGTPTGSLREGEARGGGTPTGSLREGEARFEVFRDGQKSPEASLRSPWGIMVGSHGINLREGLRWYLEDYLEMPYGEFAKRAEDVQAALSQWGRECFDKLFGGGRAHGWHHDARRSGLANLRISIASDDPAILSWPWEALESADDGKIAQQCRVERRLDKIGDLPELPNNLPTDSLNILYIIARPFGDADVGYHALARPLVDFVAEDGWPVHVDVLRPPTFSQLCAVLEEKPGHYHVVHFDGHGSFSGAENIMGAAGMHTPSDRFAAAPGKLVFEKDDQSHGGEPISAKKLCELLRKYKIPAVVLNACQSATMDEKGEDPFASVAASLLRSGVRSVAAMSYSLYVGGAVEFVPAFYRRLFKDGNMAGAMLAGRRVMLLNNKRNAFIGQVELNDWIVPVMYRHSDGFLPNLEPGAARTRGLPKEALSLDKHGFIGRERAILKLERAIREKPAAVLIHGMAGEGKTTLAKGFLQWLESTGGLGDGALWYSFEGRRGVEDIANELLEAAGEGRRLHEYVTLEQKASAIAQKLRQRRFFIVWDNFETVQGMPGTEVDAPLSEENQRFLKQLLSKLDGGKTKVLITSRSNEQWISGECYPLPLEGLEGEELWRYCEEIVRRRGITLDRSSDAYKSLMARLGGNPLAIQAILPRLAERSPKALLSDLEDSFNGIEGDEATKRIQSALSVFERGLDQAYAPALRLLSLHEGCADAKMLAAMLQSIGSKATPVKGCLGALESAGLCRQIGGGLYSLHPALRSCLTRCHPAGEAEQKAFVGVMGILANTMVNKAEHENRQIFALHAANFHLALQLARNLDMKDDVLDLVCCLAENAHNTRSFSEAVRMFNELADVAKKYREEKYEACAYHQLGMIAQERSDFDAAEGLYKKSLCISIKLGDEQGAAITYHQLGRVEQERRDFGAAEDWYNKSLGIVLKLGDEHGVATTYRQLGIVAQERGDLVEANRLYKVSLDIELKKSNALGAAHTYHQLGSVAQERRDFDAAEGWYKNSLGIALKLGNENGAAYTYHQLGSVALERLEYEEAESWYNKSLGIRLKLCDEHGAAETYHQLGIVAQERGDFAAADGWNNKSLDIKLKLGDEHGAALTYHNLGIVAEKRQNFAAAEGWYKKSLDIMLKLGDERRAATTYHQLGIVAVKQRDFAAAEGWYDKSLCIKLKLGDEHSAATTYHQLGMVALERRDFNAAEGWYNKSLGIDLKLGDEHGAASTYHQLGRVAEARGDIDSAKKIYQQSIEVFERYSDSHSAEIAKRNLARIIKSEKTDQT